MALIKLELTQCDFSLLHTGVWLAKETLKNDVVDLDERIKPIE